MADKSPAFQFYPKDFLTDEAVRLMSAEARGAYIALLCHCWLEGSLPRSMSALSRMAELPVENFQRLWKSVIGRCFYLDAHGRWVNNRLKLEQKKQKRYRELQRAKGKRGAQARWPRPSSGYAPAIVRPLAESSSSSSSSSSTPVKKSNGASSTGRVPGGAVCHHVPRCETTKTCIARTIADARKVAT